MKSLARLTAILLIFFGLIAALAGAYFISRGLMQPQPFLPGLFGAAEDTNILFPLRLMVGGTLALQGLMLTAVGEALWLVAGIAARSEHSSQHLATLAARGSMTIP